MDNTTNRKYSNALTSQIRYGYLPLLRQFFEDLDYGRFKEEDIRFTAELSKNLNQYTNSNDRRKLLGEELDIKIDDLVYLYESLVDGRIVMQNMT